MPKSKFGEAPEARKLREENARLRKLVADLSLGKRRAETGHCKNGWNSERRRIRVCLSGLLRRLTPPLRVPTGPASSVWASVFG